MRDSSASRPSLLIGAAHLTALWAVAFVLPMFSLLGNNTDFFVSRGDTGSDVVWAAVLFALAPPLAALVLESLLKLISEMARWGLQLVLVWFLSAAIAMHLIKWTMDRPAGVMIALAAILGIGATVLYVKKRPFQIVLQVLSPAPLALLFALLVVGGASEHISGDVEVEKIHIPSTAPVILILFDEFPEATIMNSENKIDVSRFPGFEELSKSSTWYRNTTTVADTTPRAVPAILTGRVPGPDTLPIASEQKHSIFTLLGGKYKMNVMEDSTRLCPVDLCSQDANQTSRDHFSDLIDDLPTIAQHQLYPNALRRDLPEVDITLGGLANLTGGQELPRFAVNNQLKLSVAFHRRDSTGRNGRLHQFIRSIYGDPKTLNMIHVESPHYPWIHFPEGVLYTDLVNEFGDSMNAAGRWKDQPQATNMALQRHLLEAGGSDRILAQLIKRMKLRGIWDKSMVVVTADHGISFKPGQMHRRAKAGNLGGNAPIPLFVKEPGQTTGRISDAHICSTEILPIMARGLGIDYPWKTSRCLPGEVIVNSAITPTNDRLRTRSSRAEVLRQRDAVIKHTGKLFGYGTGFGPVIRFRPNPQLIGRPVASLDVSGPGGGSVILEHPEWLTNVDPKSRVVYASLIRGQVKGVRKGDAIAVSVNGRIAAVGQTIVQNSEVRFSLLVPPRRLASGRNEVELYRVTGPANALRLEPLGP